MEHEYLPPKIERAQAETEATAERARRRAARLIIRQTVAEASAESAPNRRKNSGQTADRLGAAALTLAERNQTPEQAEAPLVRVETVETTERPPLDTPSKVRSAPRQVADATARTTDKSAKLVAQPTPLNPSFLRDDIAHKAQTVVRTGRLLLYGIVAIVGILLLIFVILFVT